MTVNNTSSERFPSPFEKRISDLLHTSEWFWLISSPFVIGGLGLLVKAVKAHLDN